MSKKRKSLTKEEIDVLAKYQWANITDIMNIGAIGRNKARSVFNVISDKFYSEKDKVHNGLVPMDMVLEYFNIRSKASKEIEYGKTQNV